MQPIVTEAARCERRELCLGCVGSLVDVNLNYVFNLRRLWVILVLRELWML
jgi:hypothetical protein